MPVVKIGLVGFPGCGKSTVFNALTGLSAETGYAGRSEKENLGTVKVPDGRVDSLAELYNPKKTTYAEITFTDLAGGRGPGLDRSVLNAMRNVDALCQVVRAFPDQEGAPPDPVREIADLETETLLADLEIVEQRVARLRKDRSGPTELALLERCQAAPGFPSQLLRKEAADALVAMLQAARAGGHELRVRSTYRSYEEQAVTFQYWITQLGEEEASRFSAPAGHSEHQLGTTVDLTSAGVGWQLVQSFGQTPEGEWLAAHAHEHGFALSYPQGGEEITGYAYEPWHFRYIGRGPAESWAQSELTLIEFLKLIDA